MYAPVEVVQLEEAPGVEVVSTVYGYSPLYNLSSRYQRTCGVL